MSLATTAPAAVGARRLPLLAGRPEVLPVVASALAWAFVLRGGGLHPLGGHLSHIGGVAAMVVAAMGGFAVPLVRRVATASPWWRARRSVVVAFASFLGMWVVLALGLHVVVELVTAGLVSAPALAALAAGVSAVLVLRPGRARRVVRCGRPVAIRGEGPGADADCARAGAVAAGWCARLCAPAMLAMVARPGAWWLMAGLTAIGLGERAFAPRGRAAVALGYAALAVAAFL